MEDTVFFIFTLDLRGLTSPFQKYRPMYNAGQKVNCGVCGKTLKRSSLRYMSRITQAYCSDATNFMRVQLPSKMLCLYHMIRRIIRNLQPHQSLRSNQMQYSMYLILWGNFHENFFLPREFLLFIIFKQHLLIHTEERPYSCSGCSASFIRKGDAQRHVRVVHNKVRPFQCDLCSRTFCDKKHLRWHLQHHDKSCYYFCGQCNRKFIKKDYWESHIRFLHNENTEDQSEKEVKNSDVSQLQVDINNEETLALKEKESQDDSSSFELPDFLNLDVDTGDLDFVADTNNICF